MGFGIANSLPGEVLSSSISVISVVFLYKIIHSQIHEDAREVFGSQNLRFTVKTL